MAQTTVARAFARTLREAGLQRAYGLPGEDHLKLLDALEAEGLSYIGAREESAATIMAATEAQATGRPGVVLVTIAPGLTNAVNGIAHAYLDGIPLVVVTGQHGPERAPLIVRQLLDNHRLVDSLTKWSAVASGRIHQVLAKALDTAMAAPAGPVLLELREDVASAQPLDRAEDWPVLLANRRTVHCAGSREQPLPAEVSARIGSATRPAIVVGGGCPRQVPVAELARCLRAPAFTSPSAMGIINPEEPWFAGTFMNGNLEAEVLSQCDLIVTVGLDAKDFFNAAWRYRAPIVAVNERPDTQRFAPTTYQIVGDAAAIVDGLRSSPCGSEWVESDVAAYRQHVERPFRLSDESAFTIPAALRLARCTLPPETLVAVDAGFGKPLTSYVWSMPRANQYFSAHGLSTMGYALPAANALQLTFPDRPVVAFMGDGSLLMRASEISVAAEHEIAPIYVAWMDGALAQIETKQLRQKLRPVGARLPEISCAKVADAFGGTGVDVRTLEDFRCALENALTSRQPTLIGAHVDQSNRGEWYELLRG
jgi:acetolactate synthase I/II/III large subunit